MISLKKFIPGIAWFFLLLTLICLPGEALPQPESWMMAIDYDKLIHIALFGMLGVLFMYPFIRSGYNVKMKMQVILKIAITVSLWGITTEFIQKFYIPGRSFDLFDWAADSIGALCAYITGRVLLKKNKSK